MSLPTLPTNAAPDNYQRPARGAQVDVFISYSRRDRGFVRRLYERLAQQGRAAWVDWESIPYSVDWWQEIQDGIDSANSVICVVSTGWLASEMCNKEFAYAIQRNKRIIPLLRTELDEDQVAAAWIEQTWGAQARTNLALLKKINWLYIRKRTDGREYLPDAVRDENVDAPANDLDNFDQAFQNLIRTIETDNDFTKQHTRLLIQAREWETANRDDSYLLHALELDAAQAWLAKSQTKTPAPTPLHLEYIRASADYRARLLALEAERKQQLDRSAQRAVTFGRVAIAVGVIAALLIASAILVANNQVGNANATLTQVPPTLTQIAQVISAGEARIVSLNMASAAEALTGSVSDNGIYPNGSLAMALAARGLRIAYTEQADAVLIKIKPNTDNHRRKLADNSFAAAAPSPDGHYAVVVPTFSAEAYLHNLLDPGFPTVLAHASRIGSTVFAPDSRMLLTSAEDNIVRLWSVEDGSLIRTFPHDRGVNSIAFSSDGRLIITVTSDFVVHLWDVISGRELHTLAHTVPVVQAALSSDGKSILTRTENLETERVHIWDVASGRERVTLQHHAEVKGAVFSPDSQSVLVSSVDGIVTLWDAQSGAEKFHMDNLDVYTAPAVFSLDGRVIAAHPNATTVKLWNAQTGAVLFELAQTGAFFSMSFSADSKLLAVAGDDNTINVWEVATGNLLRVIVNPETARKLVFSPDDAALVAISDSRFARVWNPQTGELRRVLTHSDTVFDATFTPDSKYILTSSSGSPQLWETNYADYLAEICVILTDFDTQFDAEQQRQYDIPANDAAPCSYRNDTGTLVTPNPPLPPTTTLAASVTAAPTLLIPTYTPAAESTPTN